MVSIDKRSRVLVVVNKWWECDPFLNADPSPTRRPTDELVVSDTQAMDASPRLPPRTRRGYA